jgi:hypothetical protein
MKLIHGDHLFQELNQAQQGFVKPFLTARKESWLLVQVEPAQCDDLLELHFWRRVRAFIVDREKGVAVISITPTKKWLSVKEAKHRHPENRKWYKRKYPGLDVDEYLSRRNEELCGTTMMERKLNSLT